MKAKLLKKLRKESKKLKLIRDEAYQYIVTDNPHNIFAQAEMEAIKFPKSRGYRITKLITVGQIV